MVFHLVCGEILDIEAIGPFLNLRKFEIFDTNEDFMCYTHPILVSKSTIVHRCRCIEQIRVYKAGEWTWRPIDV